jgi:hypothetical protein
MAIIEPLAPALNLGCRVHHRWDHTRHVGVVVGLLFHPAARALVRWHDRTTSFEAPEDLEAVSVAA